MMSKILFDPDKVLPPKLCISQSENHLYRIGLCLTTERPTDRNAFHKPLLVFVVNITFLAKMLYCIRLDDRAEQLLYLGDFSHLIGIRMHFNLACFFYTGFALSLQLTYFFNYLHRIKPNYLSVFDMMSGLITPRSIGLTNEKEVVSLTKTTRKVFVTARLATQTSVPVFQFSLSFTLFYLLCPKRYVVYGIIGSLHYTWASYYVYNIHVFAVIYFHIICRYIKIKIRAQNLRIRALNPKDVDFRKRLYQTIRSLASISREISAYNDNFWSKFLLYVWFMYGIVIVLCVYILFLSPMNTYIKIGYSYMTAIIVITFLFIMITAASVNLLTRRSYLDFNSVLAKDFASTRLFHKNKEVMLSLKVNFLSILAQESILFNIWWLHLQASTFIEGLSTGTVGFWCWKLFIVDYFSVYEVIIDFYSQLIFHYY